MESLQRKIAYLATSILSLIFFCGPAAGQSLLGDEWEKFFKEKVSFSGFIENASGLAVSHGSRFFDTSNRFIMNRFTVQPELNFNFSDEAKLFVSWRFVKEPRYSAEAKSREQSVTYFPAAPVKPLPNTFYDEDSFKPWEAVFDLLPTDRFKLRLGRQFISWGETDGLRILDVIDPQDNTIFAPAAPNLFSLEETRIPQWGVRMLYTVRPVSNTILEFFANPGLEPKKKRVDDISPGNDISDGHADGDARFGR